MKFYMDDEEVEDWSLPYIIGIGTFVSYTSKPLKDPPVEKDPIGFIRPKKKDVQQPKARSKNPVKGKRPTKKGPPPKGADSKRAVRPVRKQSRSRAVGFRPAGSKPKYLTRDFLSF